MKIWLSPGLQTTNAKKQPYFTRKHCFRAKFFTIYSSFLWISHISIHSIIHSIMWWKIFIQRIYSFNKKSKLFIQRIYSFKTIPNYSFKENIHSSEKWIIAQGWGGGAGGSGFPFLAVWSIGLWSQNTILAQGLFW